MALLTALMATLLAAQTSGAPPAAPPSPAVLPAPTPRFTPTIVTQAEAAADPDGPPLALGEDDSARMTIALRLGATERHFLVDTGAERSAVSHALAAALGGARRPAEVQGVFGARPVELVAMPPAEVGGHQLTLGETPILRRADMGADGILGTDALRGKRVRFDFTRRAMHIVPAAQRLERIERDAIVIRAKNRSGRMILTDVRLGGIEVVAIVDSGSQVSLGNLALLAQLERRRAIAARVGGPDSTDPDHQVLSATGQRRPVTVATIHNLDFATMGFERVRLAFDDAAIFTHLGYAGRPAILLGMDLLGKFDQLSIDFSRRQLRFVVPDARTGIALCTGYQESACRRGRGQSG